MVKGYFCVFLTLLFFLGCNSGIQEPGELVGTWDATITQRGEFTWPEGPQLVDETVTVEMQIDQKSILMDGDPVEWSYDGSTLLITTNETISIMAWDCGIMKNGNLY